MAEKVVCPKCGGVAYTASPQVKSKCPYCRGRYKIPKPREIYSFHSHIKGGSKY